MGTALRRRIPTAGIQRVGIYAGLVIIPWVWLSLTIMSDRLGTRVLDDDLPGNLLNAIRLAVGGPALLAAILAPAVILLARRPKDREFRTEALYVLLLLVLVPALGWMVSRHTPILSPRNFLVLLPPVLILFLRAVRGLLPARAWAYPVLGLAVLLAVLAWPKTREIKSEFRETAGLIAADESCKDATILVMPDNGYGTFRFDYYLDRVGASGITPVTARDPQLAEAVGRIMSQPCPAAVWTLHFPPEHFLPTIRESGLDPDALERRDFNGSSIFFKRDAPPPP
jgi:hypothetical protein